MHSSTLYLSAARHHHPGYAWPVALAQTTSIVKYSYRTILSVNECRWTLRLCACVLERLFRLAALFAHSGFTEHSFPKSRRVCGAGLTKLVQINVELTETLKTIVVLFTLDRNLVGANGNKWFNIIVFFSRFDSLFLRAIKLFVRIGVQILNKYCKNMVYCRVR